MGRQLTKAQTELGKAQETVARWQAEAIAKRSELAALEARVGDDVLADENNAERITRQVADLRAAVDTAERTLTAAAQKAADAQINVDRATAAELRDQAAELRNDAAKRQEKTDRLLADLKAHEGPDYVPWEPNREPGRLVMVDGAEVLSWKIPMTKSILNQAAHLEAQAAEIEAKFADHDRRRAPARPLVTIVSDECDPSDSTGIMYTRQSAPHAASAHVTVGRSEGAGPISFDIHAGGRSIKQVTIPDGARTAPDVDLSIRGAGIPCGQLVEVYADGALVASATVGKHNGKRVTAPEVVAAAS